MAASSTYTATDGGAYERFLGRWTQFLANVFREFARLPDDGPVIDVGCGTGSLAVSLAQVYPHRDIVGVDISEPYIAFARQRKLEAAPRFEVGDASALQFADGTFSAALTQLVLNFVPYAERAAHEMRRVTRPGGVVAACGWDFRGGLVYQRLFWDTAAGIDPAAGVARDKLFSGPLALPDGFPALWRAAGLREIERGSLTIRMVYKDFADYWDPLLGGQGPFASYVSGIAADKQERIREAVRLAYLSGAVDGPRSMTATAWAVRGTVPQ